MKKDGTDFSVFLTPHAAKLRSTQDPNTPSYYKHGVLALLLCTFSAVLAPSKALAQQSIVVDINVFGVNSNQDAASQQLDSACTAVANGTSEAELDLQNTCQLISELDRSDPNDVARLQSILDAFAPEEAFSVNDSIVYVSDYQTTNVHARINALRSPPTFDASSEVAESSWKPESSAGFYLQDGNVPPDFVNSGGGAAADELTSRLGVFLSAQVSSGDVDGSTFEQDADISSSSFTAIADYRLSDNWVTGLGLGVLQNETSFSNVDGSTDSEGFNLTAFGSWYEESKGYVDIVLDFGSNSHDLERSIGNDPGIPVLAQASTDSTAFSLSVGAGRYITLSNWDLGGYLRLSMTNGSIDGYTEQASNSGAGSGSLFSFDSQTAESRRFIIGVEASRAISTRKAVLIPLVRIEYEAETEEKKDNLQATLVASQTTASYRGTDRDTAYTNLGLGGSAVFKNGKSAYAFYETHLQHDFVTQNWLKFGLRLEF